MKFRASKDDLSHIVTTIRKIVGKPANILLKTSEKSQTLSVIAEGNTYIKCTVPVTEAKKGNALIKFSYLEGMLKMRKKSFLVEKDKSQLNIDAGTKANIFCLEEDPPSELSSEDKFISIKLDNDKMMDIKSLINKINFSFLFSGTEFEGTPCILKFSKKGLVVALADSSHCAIYTTKTRFTKKKINIGVNFDILVAVLTSLKSETTLKISDKMVIVESQDLVSTIPVIQEGVSPVENAIEWKDNLKSGKIIIAKEKVSKALTSLSCTIYEGADIINLKVKKGKAELKLTTSFGSAKDKLDVKCTIEGDLEVRIPLVYLEDSIGSCSSFPELYIEVDKDYKLYKISAEDKGISVVTRGTLWQEEK